MAIKCSKAEETFLAPAAVTQLSEGQCSTAAAKPRLGRAHWWLTNLTGESTAVQESLKVAFWPQGVTHSSRGHLKDYCDVTEVSPPLKTSKRRWKKFSNKV